MHTPSLLAAVTLAALSSCSAPGFSVQAGYAQLSLDGDIGFATSGAAISQDIESAFGLGDSQGTPFGRAVLDLGTPVLSASGFMFEDEGTGQLQADFGGIAASTQVRSDLQLTNVKGALAFQISLGPVAISPGIAVDYFDLDIDVSDTFGAITESVEVAGPVPMGFLRAEAEFWKIGLVAEAGYMQIDIDDVTASLLDIEALIEIRPTALLDLFAGYRHLGLQVDGLIDGDAFDTDIMLSGFVVGGGVRF